VPFSALISSPPTIRFANSLAVGPLITAFCVGLLSAEPEPEVRRMVCGTLSAPLKVVRPDLS